MSPNGLTERANSFDERCVLQTFASEAGAGRRVEELRAQAARFARRTDVVHLDDGTMTTAELLESESGLIDAALGRYGEGTGVIADTALERALAGSDGPLTSEQARRSEQRSLAATA